MLDHVSVEQVDGCDDPHTSSRFFALAHGCSELANAQLDVSKSDTNMEEWVLVKFFTVSPFLEPTHHFPRHLLLAHVDFFHGTAACGQEELGFFAEHLGEGLALADACALFLAH